MFQPLLCPHCLAYEIQNYDGFAQHLTRCRGTPPMPMMDDWQRQLELGRIRDKQRQEHARLCQRTKRRRRRLSRLERRATRPPKGRN